MSVFLRTILLGIATGSIYALAATGLVLTYKASGVLNFGYGAVAMFTTFVYWQMAAVWGLPVIVAALLVLLVVAPLLGVFLDRQIFSRIQGQPMVITVIATVGLAVLLQGFSFLIWGHESRRVPSLFPTGTISFAGARIGIDDLAIFLVASGAAVLLAVMFRFTRVGVAFRAVVDNRAVAELMAINSARVSGFAWALGTSFAALTGMLLSPDTLLDPNFLPLFVIAQVFGAAIVGYLRSLPLAFAGGIGLGVAQGLLIQYGRLQGTLTNFPYALSFFVVILLVLFAPRAVRMAGLATSFVVRTREVAEQRSPALRRAVAVVVFGGLALVPILAGESVSWKLSLARGMALAIVFLSLVILTGYSGQVSLGHSAFMGIAAFSAAYLSADAGWPSWLAFAAGVLAAVPAGVLLGIIAVRLHGLFLALVTLGFAFTVQELFFNDVRVSGGTFGVDLPRPAGASGNNAFFYVVFAFLVMAALLAQNLRGGRTGRALAAIRDSETATRALGISVFKYKVVVFAISALMAGLGAVLHGMLIERVGQFDFSPFLSLMLVTIAVVGGIFHVGGAITSGLLLGLYPQLFGRIQMMQRLQLILFGIGATLALAQNPEGFFGELRRGGNALVGALRRRPRAHPAPMPVSGGER